MSLVKDIWLRVTSERKSQVIAVVVVGSLIWLVFGDSGKRRIPPPQQQVSVGANNPREQWEDLVERFDVQLTQMKSAQGSQAKELEDMKKSMQDYEATTAEIFKKVLERLNEVQNAQSQVGSSAPGDGTDVGSAELASVSPDELESIAPPEAVEVRPPAKAAPRKIAFIGPGDSVRLKLLAGVNAPTDGTPYPVVFKLIGDVNGPDGSSIPLGEARLIAAAQGSLTDSRALFRMTRLSVRMPNGRRKEFGVDGWIVGEDGIRGMEGVLIDPIGKAIAGAGFAGALAGLGQGIAASNTTVLQNGFGTTSFIRNGDIPEFAAGQGLSQAALAWQNIIRERVNQLVPVVQVLSGREATAVFSQSLAIPDLLEQFEDEDQGIAFNSLD